MIESAGKRRSTRPAARRTLVKNTLVQAAWSARAQQKVAICGPVQPYQKSAGHKKAVIAVAAIHAGSRIDFHSP